MPNYTKPVWIVLNPKGESFEYRRRPLVASKLLAIYDAVDDTLIPWRELYHQGYRCVKAALSWGTQVARPESEWHEDIGDVLWWKFPVDEAPYVGTPLDDDWPGYHTHWTPCPEVPVEPEKEAPCPKT